MIKAELKPPRLRLSEATIDLICTELHERVQFYGRSDQPANNLYGRLIKEALMEATGKR